MEDNTTQDAQEATPDMKDRIAGYLARLTGYQHLSLGTYPDGGVYFGLLGVELDHAEEGHLLWLDIRNGNIKVDLGWMSLFTGGGCFHYNGG